jgi:hypothetical protein
MDNTMTLDFNSKSNEDLPLSITMNGIEYFSSKLFDSSQNLSKINLELSKVGLELCRNEISEPSSPDKYESIINDALKYGDGYTAYQDGYFAGKKNGYDKGKEDGIQIGKENRSPYLVVPVSEYPNPYNVGYVEGYNACIDCFNINYEHKIDIDDVSDM